MKGRISSTIWLVTLLNLVALCVMLGLAYGAGAKSGGLSLLDFGNLPSASGLRLAIAVLALIPIAVLTTVSLLGSRIVKPTEKLVDYSEKIAAGDYRAQADIS